MSRSQGSRVDASTAGLLFVAVALEVIGTACLRLSEGLTRPGFALGIVVSYAASIAVFSRVLNRGIPLGVAYGILTGSGLAAATGLSVIAFGDALTAIQVVAIVVLGLGVWLLQADRW